MMLLEGLEPGLVVLEALFEGFQLLDEGADFVVGFDVREGLAVRGREILRAHGQINKFNVNIIKNIREGEEGL